ncbi:unnamed protein product [Polarella glacialis]|uniref:Uncharacterized protein n=1 Tax=Polarella glacialis TaxID=89957 RepID=A0A813FLH3_POLGL|nr:unnamed protein product [Polarella glacialis]
MVVVCLVFVALVVFVAVAVVVVVFVVVVAVVVVVVVVVAVVVVVVVVFLVVVAFVLVFVFVVVVVLFLVLVVVGRRVDWGSSIFLEGRASGLTLGGTALIHPSAWLRLTLGGNALIHLGAWLHSRVLPKIGGRELRCWRQGVLRAKGCWLGACVVPSFPTRLKRQRYKISSLALCLLRVLFKRIQFLACSGPGG